MAMITENTLAFLRELKSNNNRDCFIANKRLYDEARHEFEKFVDNLIIQIADFDPSIAHHTAAGTVFRIYRDVRFGKDKSPYKTHLGAYISAAKTKSDIHSFAGYYIHVEPSGGSMLAGGAYEPQGQWLKNIRKEIHYNGDEFKKIIGGKSFVDYFGALEGEKLKTAPRDYPKDHPDLELLKQKSFLAVHNCTDKEVISPDFAAYAEKVFRALYPLNNFLNEAAEQS
ncbi:MAG: DUF2461 domain-containing protein [Bacteroidales bacterium]|nr:DUF2461 domain-containing protein [Bacteroidales bacterium]